MVNFDLDQRFDAASVTKWFKNDWKWWESWNVCSLSWSYEVHSVKIIMEWKGATSERFWKKYVEWIQMSLDII